MALRSSGKKFEKMRKASDGDDFINQVTNTVMDVYSNLSWQNIQKYTHTSKTATDKIIR